MNNEEKSRIYDRLLAINIEISSGVTPDPQYINRKIGECHIHIGEVEKFYINVSKEMSIIQRALNNAKAKYDSEKEALFDRADIKILPTIVEREAKANSFLKEGIREIQGYESELIDLNNLSKAINLKLRNLARTNGDIKSLLKMVEAQIRLGSPTDPVAKGFMEEMSKGIAGEDSFKDIVTKTEEVKVLDPTVPIDIEDLLVGDVQSSEETETEEQDDQKEDDLDPNNLSEDAGIIKEAEESILRESVVDLDAILEPTKPQERGETAKDVKEETVTVTVAPVTVAPVTVVAESEKIPIKNSDPVRIDGQVDLDDLLKQYNK